MTVLARKEITLCLSTPDAIRHMGQEPASDNVMLVYWDGMLVAWTDDYGTAHHPDHEVPAEIQEKVETYVEAAMDLWAVLDV